MKKEGFTLVELLVVVAIIALLVAILAPALSRVKQHAERVVCGTNLKGLGNSFAVYAAAFDGDYPVQGDNPEEPHRWDWYTNGFQDGSAKNWAQSGTITVGASLYLLIRETDVTPKQFVCPSGEEKPYKGENAGGPSGEALDIVELWDFGMYLENSAGPGRGPQYGPRNHVSYSYQLPYVTNSAFPAYPADSSADARMAIMADKNPWYDPELTYIDLASLRQDPDASETYVSFVSYIDFRDTLPDDEPNPDWERWMVEVGNARPHLRQGQEILWGDGHATFVRRPDVGVKNDNIYVPCGGGDLPPWNVWNVRKGSFNSPPPRIGATDRAKGAIDSFLVNDDEILLGGG